MRGVTLRATTKQSSSRFRKEEIASFALKNLCFAEAVDSSNQSIGDSQNQIDGMIITWNAEGKIPVHTDFVALSTPAPSSGAVTHHPVQEEIDNLAANILDGVPGLSDVPDGCNFLEVVMAIEESAATGKPVAVSGP